MRKKMGYFEDRRPSWGAQSADEAHGENGIFRADGADDEECRFHERMKDKRFSPPQAGFAEMNIIYPFIDRNLKTDQWTRQDDGSFVFRINGRSAYVSFEDGEILASRADGACVYIDSLYALESFLL